MLIRKQPSPSRGEYLEGNNVKLWVYVGSLMQSLAIIFGLQDKGLTERDSYPIPLDIF